MTVKCDGKILTSCRRILRPLQNSLATAVKLDGEHAHGPAFGISESRQPQGTADLKMFPCMVRSKEAALDPVCKTCRDSRPRRQWSMQDGSEMFLAFIPKMAGSP